MTLTNTTMLTFNKITLDAARKQATITLVQADGSTECELIVPEALILPAIIELFTVYKIGTMFVTDVLPEGYNFQDMMTEWKMLEPKSLGINGEVTVTYPNGDTGAMDMGHGASLLDAIADIARSHGFKSRLEELKRVTVHEWFDAFAYGMERRSQEILTAELAEMLGDPNGSW